MHCANFLIELIAGDVDTHKEILRPLNKSANHTLGDFKALVQRHRVKLIGDFRGKWTLPYFYLNVYIDKHGKDRVQEGVDAPNDESDILDAMKGFIELGEHTDGSNKSAEGCYGSDSMRVSDITKSDHVMLYDYSEWLSQVMLEKMCLSKNVHACCIIAPPLGVENNLLTFTDGLIVNKSHYSDVHKADTIDKFIEFYTSLRFQNQYAEGKDLKEHHLPQYLLFSRKDFYTKGFGAHEKNYQMLQQAMNNTIGVPNHGLALKKDEMIRMLEVCSVHINLKLF